MKYLSLIALLIISVTYLSVFHVMKSYNFAIVGGGDTLGYYMYLPAAFIHNDLATLDITNNARKQHLSSDKKDERPEDTGLFRVTENGNYVNKYPMGMAVLYAPFFFIAHALAKIKGIPADGFSPIYIYIIMLSSFFYALTGLILLRKVLLNYFSDAITALLLLGIALGTNLYYFVVLNSAMSHAYLFFLYATLLYFTEKWHRKEGYGNAASIGLFAGLICLVRPVHIICLFIPLFWGLRSFKAIPERIKSLSGKSSFLLAVVLFILVGIFQLIYWKYTTGHFIYYSYGDEGFDFLKPHILEGLFGFKNGWLAYTPIMYFALFGIPLLFRNRNYWIPILLFLPIHIYITYSWWCWNYINGFGSRPMVETYALLSIPMGYFFTFLYKKGKMIFAFLILLVTFFIALNVFQTYQHFKGILWSEDANWAYYKAIFGKTKAGYSDLVTYDMAIYQPDTSDLKYVRTLAFNDFNDSLSPQYSGFPEDSTNFFYRFAKGDDAFPSVKFRLKENSIEAGDWLKMSVDCMRPYAIQDIYRMTLLICAIDKGNSPEPWRFVRLDNKPQNTDFSIWGGRSNVWATVYAFVKVPKGITEEGFAKIFLLKPAYPDIYLDNFKVEHWKKSN